MTKITWIIFAFFILSNEVYADLISENIEYNPPGGSHALIRRFYTDVDEAKMKCQELANDRRHTYCSESIGYPNPSMITISGGNFDCRPKCSFYPENRFIFMIFKACRPGYAYVGSEEYCSKETLVSINGASSTTSLPQGPDIPLTIKIKDSRGKISNVKVDLELFEGDISKIKTYGYTNSEGVYLFKYVPPFFRASEVSIKATCAECDNQAAHEISVLPSNLEPAGVPEMCGR
ncbi:hypothetical protein GCM10027276_34570 [Comamonas piscis]